MPDLADLVRLVIWTCGIVVVVIVAVIGVEWARHREEDLDIRRALDAEETKRNSGGGAS